MPTRTGVQTDVHIMPVCSDLLIRNLLKVEISETGDVKHGKWYPGAVMVPSRCTS